MRNCCRFCLVLYSLVGCLVPTRVDSSFLQVRGQGSCTVSGSSLTPECCWVGLGLSFAHWDQVSFARSGPGPSRPTSSGSAWSSWSRSGVGVYVFLLVVFEFF